MKTFASMWIFISPFFMLATLIGSITYDRDIEIGAAIGLAYSIIAFYRYREIALEDWKNDRE